MAHVLAVEHGISRRKETHPLAHRLHTRDMLVAVPAREGAPPVLGHERVALGAVRDAGVDGAQERFVRPRRGRLTQVDKRHFSLARVFDGRVARRRLVHVFLLARGLASATFSPICARDPAAAHPHRKPADRKSVV